VLFKVAVDPHVCRKTGRSFNLNLNAIHFDEENILLVQQTPNPEAHDPAAAPPLAEHSAEVKQVPL
jgi:hypothetical protein